MKINIKPHRKCMSDCLVACLWDSILALLLSSQDTCYSNSKAKKCLCHQLTLVIEVDHHERKTLVSSLIQCARTELNCGNKRKEEEKKNKNKNKREKESCFYSLTRLLASFLSSPSLCLSCSLVVERIRTYRIEQKMHSRTMRIKALNEWMA